MATERKEKVRLFCIGNKLALLKDDELSGFLDIEPSEIKKEIENQIREGNRQPTCIFKYAIEKKTGIEFSLKCKKLGLSIHDSEYYKSYLEFIKASLNVEKKNKRYEEEKIAKEKFMKKEKEYMLYFSAINMQHEKDRRNHKKNRKRER